MSLSLDNDIHIETVVLLTKEAVEHHINWAEDHQAPLL